MEGLLQRRYLHARPVIPALLSPPQSALGYSGIDWGEMIRETQTKRVAVLRKVLNVPQPSNDSFRMVLVGEKMNNFQYENELVEEIQKLETTNLPAPGTPKEHNRKEQVGKLINYLQRMRMITYPDVAVGDGMRLPMASAAHQTTGVHPQR